MFHPEAVIRLVHAKLQRDLCAFCAAVLFTLMLPIQSHSAPPQTALNGETLVTASSGSLSVVLNSGVTEQERMARLVMTEHGKLRTIAHANHFSVYSDRKVDLDNAGTKAIIIVGYSGGVHCCAAYHVFADKNAGLTYAGELPGGDRDPLLGVLINPTTGQRHLVASDPAFDAFLDDDRFAIKPPLLFRYDGKRMVLDAAAMKRSVDDALQNNCRPSGVMWLPDPADDQASMEADQPNMHVTFNQVVADLKDIIGEADRSQETARVAVCLICAGQPNAAHKLIGFVTNSKRDSSDLDKSIKSRLDKSHYGRTLLSIALIMP